MTFIFGALFFLFSANVIAMNGNGVHISCDSYKKALSYKNFGLNTPPKSSGWTCNVEWAKIDPSNTITVWQKNKKRILFSQYKVGKFDLGAFKQYIDHASSIPEPMKTIRLNTEAFLGSPEFAKKNEMTAGLVAQFAPEPKAILFSPNNERILIYEGNKEHKAEGMHSVDVYRKDDAQYYLDVVCMHCTADEFFSMVVNPLIQK
jgi:hypothetical protein